MNKLKKYLNFSLFVMIVLLSPRSVFATDVFDSILDNGKLVIPSIPQTGIMGYDTISSYFYEDLQTDIDVGSCNDTFTTCTLNKDGESRDVEVVWKYDKDIKKIVDAIAAQYPVDKTNILLKIMKY